MILGLGHWWMEVDSDGMPTGSICSAFYGESDKPVEGKWVLVVDSLNGNHYKGVGFSWSNDFAGMTKEYAQVIKALRISGCSWGRIAEIMEVVTGTNEEWGQVAGKDMCDKAALIFNEDPNLEPWN